MRSLHGPDPARRCRAPTARRSRAPTARLLPAFLAFASAALGLLPVAVTAQETSTPESHFFTASDGVRIHYLTAGGEGSWVVLIHGYTDTAERMWFRTGIGPALAANHRVVALDNRNHGESDTPEPNGPGRAEDVIELMDHLGIDRAHIHGYSMGGGMTGSLLASHPHRFITAGFGGSGIRERDPELARQAEALDPEMPEPDGAAAAAFQRLRERAASRDRSEDSSASDGGSDRADGDDSGNGGDSGNGADLGNGDGEPQESPAPRLGPEIDLASLDVPVIAINGEYDRPYSKTRRMWRELKIFQNVVLPGHNHMTAIMVGGPMPQQYIDSMVAFIRSYDLN